MPSRYDDIGRTYASTRRPDPRFARAVIQALGDARTVVNVGAGTGSYEPEDRVVTAVEPSAVMRAQRPDGAAPCVAGVAEDLPFGDGEFDASLAILTIHHWTDWRAGCAELRRVASERVVMLSWDPLCADNLWLGPDYFPGLWAQDVARFPSLDEQAAAIGAQERRVLPVPHDCVDGFLGANWRRPEAYLDPVVRAGVSTFALSSEADLAPGLARLAADLADGSWAERHAGLLELEALDLGYRLLVAEL